ncbi:RE1-silencing transcription factor [Pelodytes ibericus]
MATQMVAQSGGSSLFCNNANFGISLDGDMYGLHDISKADMAAPRLIMLANVALTGEVSSSSCCDYSLEEERQMAELTTVNDNSFSDSDGERAEDSHGDSDSRVFEIMEVEPPITLKDGGKDHAVAPPAKGFDTNLEKDVEMPTPTEDKNKCLKSKPFRCKPCQYVAKNEEEFVLHIKSHSAKPFIDNDAPNNTQNKESDSCILEEADFFKGPICCDRCGYNTSRFDHYLAHLKHHNKVGENERVYKCSICTYTTVSEYHWKKHLRNHFPRIVYTCSQCSYFSDRKNNYIQHIRTHTGERPYQCRMCPYSSSQKTHLTRHMRTHSGERPFKCEQCSYVASNQHEVTRHGRQVHNGPKPLTCPHCDYRTADRSNFKKHVELHVNPRQFLCPVCDYAASKKCNLQYHIKSRHSGCSDITMDVSKIKLRTKKGEVGILNDGAGIQDDNGNVKLNNQSEDKKPDNTIQVEKKENCVKPKKQITEPVPVQVHRSSRRLITQIKSDSDNCSPEISSKVKCVKRKAGAQSETSAAQNIKKKKLVQKNRHSQEVVTKAVGSEKSQKQKGRGVKKNKENKHFLKKQKKMTVLATEKKKIKTKKVVLDHNIEEEPLTTTQAPISENEALLMEDRLPISVEEPSVVHAEIPDADSEETKDSDTESKELERVIENLSTCKNDTDMDSFSQDAANQSNTLAIENDKEFAEAETVDSSSATVKQPCDLQTTDVPKVHSEILQVDEPIENMHCQVSETEPQSMQHSQLELGESSERTFKFGDDKEQVEGDKLEINEGKVVQTIPENPCHLEVSSEPDVKHKLENGCTLQVNEEVKGQEESINTCDLQESNELEEKDMTESSCNLEISMGDEVDNPKDNCALEIKEKLLGQDACNGAQHFPAECCMVDLKDSDPKEVQASTSSCNGSISEPVDIEEDEGIHSHDGSDISDNVSERSDDSGLNGVASIQENIDPKSTDEPNSATTEIRKESLVCIFCDRAFKKEEEYTKHLKRHLVNVYYLEKAAQSQA